MTNVVVAPANGGPGSSGMPRLPESERKTLFRRSPEGRYAPPRT
jgi:hypothetical protein